jgi:hypothetical protein
MLARSEQRAGIALADAGAQLSGAGADGREGVVVRGAGEDGVVGGWRERRARAEMLRRASMRRGACEGEVREGGHREGDVGLVGQEALDVG